MVRGSLIVLIVLGCSLQLNADIVVEPYEVGGVFETGVAGLDPGDQISFFNRFDSSPAFLGEVEIRDPRSVLAGNGDVRFTGNMSGQLARVDFDMGLQVGDSTLADAMLTNTEITFSDIDGDADPTNFVLLFSAQTIDGSTILDLADLTITQSNGTFTFADFDAGLFQAELTGFTGKTSITFTSNNGSFLRSMQFRGINPDVAADEMVVSGSRTISFTAVPEPTGGALLATILGIAGLRRRRLPRR